MGFRTPLARVRGLGSAKDGVHHWWMLRVTSVALVPLTIWFLFSLMKVSGQSLDAVQQWLESPLRALLLTAFLAATAYHGKLGIQVIVEDYVHKPFCKYTLLLANTFGFALLFIMAVMAIFTLHTL